MSLRRFFSDTPVLDGTVTIEGDELFHLLKVNRARVGDAVEVVNGKGSLFYCKIRTIKGSHAYLDIVKEEVTAKPPVNIVIAPSLLKKKTMSLLIEKLTEIGVDEIRPVLFSRTEERVSSSTMEKWHRIAVQSLKVNKRLWLTTIYPPVELASIVELSKTLQGKIALDLDGQNMTTAELSFPGIAVIGPPGDFVHEEKQLLKENGFGHYRINDCTLKSETAAISIASVLKMRVQPE